MGYSIGSASRMMPHVPVGPEVRYDIKPSYTSSPIRSKCLSDYNH